MIFSSHITIDLITIQSETDMFSHHLENQMSHAPVTYHRMDVLPEAKTCYYTDTVSYAGISASYYQFLFNSDTPKSAKV